MASVTNICFDDKNVYAYANGYLFCLDPKTGSIKWENSLSGLGHSHCIIASQSDQQQSIAAGAINQNAAASGAG